MADERQRLQSEADPEDPSNPESFWKRSKRALGGKNFTFLQHVPKKSEDAPGGAQEGDAKAAHTRRREQVRRAQRNHRERKERYIKTLEREVLRLRDEEAAIAQETRNMREELDILKDLLARHGIPPPRERATPFNPNATVSVFDVGRGAQGLHVEMPSPDFFNAHTDYTSPLSAGGFSGSDGTTVVQPRTAASVTHSSPEKDLPRLPSGSPEAFHPHPHDATRSPPQQQQQPGLDTAQIGIDFVLTLEQPCLGHTRAADPNSLEGAPSGHALTAQAVLLTHAPENLALNTSWQIPAIEIERLLELSAGLNLIGELTPVQAWNRIKSYPGLLQFADAARRLEGLKLKLKGEVRCYAFGAVVDETVFEAYLREAFAITSPNSYR